MLRMEFYELPGLREAANGGPVRPGFCRACPNADRGVPLPSKLIVDLSEVNYVDAVGEEVLLWFKKIGVTFTAESAYSHHVCEQLQLPVEPQLPACSHPGHQGTRGHAQRCRPSKRTKRGT